MSEKKQKVPKLRFPGFTGEWEQRKLCEVAEITMGQSPSSKNYTDNPEDFILVQGNADLKNGAVVPRLWTKEVTKTAEANSIILTVRAPVGEVAISGYDVVLGRGVAGIKGNDFIYYVLLCLKEFHYWEKLSSGSTFDSINSNDIKEILINMPNEKEQEVITGQLKNIDNLITLHLHKLENLKLKKKALLQKLFPKNGMQFPELRFPGFTDDWEQRKLSDFTERVVRKNGEESNRPLTISAQDGLVDQREYFNRQVASKDMSNYYLIKNGEFAYNKSYSEGYPFGAVKRLDYYESGALSTLYIVFKLIDANVLSDFIVAYYMTHLWYGEISKRASEGARNHGLLNISPADFFQSEMLIPTNVSEQRLIGEFFENFDNLITLHQRKLEHLQLQKKALLQQMFV